MQQSLLSAKWTQVLSDVDEERADKYTELCQVRDALAAMPGPMARIYHRFARGIDDYLNEENSSLEEKCGLKPEQGRRYETVWEQRRQQKLNELSRYVASQVCGSTWKKADAVAAWFKQYKAGRTLPDGTPLPEEFVTFIRTFPRALPSSRDQFFRILQKK